METIGENESRCTVAMTSGGHVMVAFWRSTTGPVIGISGAEVLMGQDEARAMARAILSAVGE